MWKSIIFSNNITVAYIVLNVMTTSHSFFNKLTLPSVPAEQNSLLGGEISNAEILQAIKSLKCNKTPGPDGYT